MNKKVVSCNLILISVLVASILLSAACSTTSDSPPSSSKVPAWYNDLAVAYPEDQYLAMVGSGNDLESARQNAQAQLANYFGMTVNAVTSGSVEYSDKSSNQKAGIVDSQLSRSVSQSVKTVSNQKLFAVKYSEAFVQKSSTALVAYIVVADALNQIRAEKKSRLDATAHYLGLASSAPSVLERHINLLAANSLISRLNELDSSLRTLKAPASSETAQLVEKARALKDKIQSQLTASIELNDPDVLFGNLLNEALSNLDIKPMPAGSLKLKAVASVKPLKLSTQSNLHTHEWTLSLDLIDETGATWFANQATGRSSGSTDDTAKLRARMEVEKFIKNQFSKALLDQLLAKVSGD